MENEKLQTEESRHLLESEESGAEDPLVADENEEPRAAHNSRRAWQIAGILLVLVVGGMIALWWLAQSKKLDEASAEKPVVSVRVAKVEKKTLATEISAIGTIFPRAQAVVSANSNGQIKQMRQLKNVVVRRGEVLAQLDARDLEASRAEAQAALREAELNLKTTAQSAIPQTIAQTEKDLADAKAVADNARASLQRRQSLYDKGGIALKDLQDSQLALANAENNLKLAKQSSAIKKSATNPDDLAVARGRIAQAADRIKTIDAQISFAVVRAPLTGIVVEQFQFAGEYATAGGKLLTIADISEVVVKTQFSDLAVADLQFGDAATVLPNDSPEERIGGKVSLISRSADAQNRTVEVWVNLGNGAGKLRAGGAANVIIGTNAQANAVVVPILAVTLDAANENEGVVMTVDASNMAHETKIEVGIKTKDEFQIVFGLDGGETVIIEGNYALPDGTQVEIKEDDQPDEKGAAEK